MPIDLKAPEKVVLKPIITVFGIGGGGGNAVNNMIEAKLQEANFVVANTDAQALAHSKCDNKIQLGAVLTKGLGAGASLEMGAMAAEESAEEIKGYLEGSDMVFITSGMGGGTGSGASYIVAKIAKELGILTVGVVTKPFNFEGNYRMQTAERGLTELQKYVDTLIVIQNQNLFSVTNEFTSFVDAFKVADNVLRAAVQSILDVISKVGLMNRDFADVKALMTQMGKAMMGTGEASGENRAIAAAEAAIFNPLLAHTSIRGAKGVLISIMSGEDMTLIEIDTIATWIKNAVGENTNANIIVGAIFNPELNGVIKVSVIATGIDSDEISTASNLEESLIIAKKKSEFITEDILEQEPPIFDNFHMEGQQDENYEIRNNLSDISLEDVMDKNATTGDEESLSHHAYGHISSNLFSANSTHDIAPKKRSFFGKMWNSLKSSDKPLPITKTPIINNLEEKPNTSALNPKLSDVSEVPAFFRKPK